jgi:two-component system, OmpR family, phosphate regulon sensor histidine kinase PhoR
MNGTNRNNCLAAMGLLLCSAPAVLWASGLLPVAASGPLRLGVTGGGMALGLGLFLLAMIRWRNAWQALDRNLQALCQLDPRSLRNDDILGDLPPLAASSPFAAVAHRLHETFRNYCLRIQDLEHARSALEVRCRRATTQTEQIREIFSAISDPILAVDDYRDLVLANRGAEELFHLDPQPESRAIERLVQCERLVELLTSVAQRKSSGMRSDEIEIADADGQQHWYRATAAKLGMGGGEGEPASRGAVAVLRDIGDQKAMQKRNAEFVSAVSHEMKTPLAGIKAYVELLIDGDADDEATQAEFLNVISGQADRLQRLVENLLNLARIEAGVVHVSKQTRSLNELLEEALRVVQPSAEAKQIELASELSQMYLGVLADRDMLLQAAINLLSNAIKYTHAGGRVALRSRMVDDQIRFEVQDTGVGLSEEDCQRVFEKFYRVNKDKGMAAGTGLGLPLAKHIVEDVHGGRLTVESALGAGSTFIVTLPNAGQLTAATARTPAGSRG